MDGGLGERLFKFAIDVIKYLKLLTLEIKKQENIWLMNQVSLKKIQGQIQAKHLNNNFFNF